MIGIIFTVLTVFAIIVLTYKRISKDKFKIIKEIIDDVNEQYKNILKSRARYKNTLQWFIYLISQVFIAFAIVSTTFIQLLKYIDQSQTLILKVTVVGLFFVAIYFVVGICLIYINQIYKFLYEIEDTTTKTDLLISYFIISVYMTVLVIFPKQFRENYKSGLVGAFVSYYLNLKALVKIMRSPHIADFESEGRIGIKSIRMVAVILLAMVIISLFLAVCFVNSSGWGVYIGNPTFFDLFYYTVITFATIGYGDIVPISPAAKFMSMLISMTSILCLTIFMSSILGYEEEDDY